MSTAISDPHSDSYRKIDSAPRKPKPSDYWDDLPSLTRRQVRLGRRVARLSPPGRLPPGLGWLEIWLGDRLELGPPEVLDRASGLKRGGLVAIFSLPGLATRVGVGVEVPLAHAVVDRLLGYNRPAPESRLQLSPVEWGIWTFLFAKALDQLAPGANPGSPPGRSNDPIAWPELYLDRVGPDPFRPDHLGRISTVCWSSKLGATTGTVRLWLPEPVVDLWLRSEAPPVAADPERIRALLLPTRSRSHEFSSEWRSCGGSVTLPRGLKGIRAGSLLPIISQNPVDAARGSIGRVELFLDLDGSEGRLKISARPSGEPGGTRLAVTSAVRHDPPPTPTRESPSVSGNLPPDVTQAATPNPGPPSNLPVTLTVELGRVNLTLSRLADLKPGDIVELSRPKREPVELTSNGRVVARGELVKIDSEVGVRITSVFL